MRSSPAAISEILGGLAESERVNAEEELLADARDRNVGDLDLLFANEREQQIERTGEVLELDDEGRVAGIERRECGAQVIRARTGALDASARAP